MINWKNKAQFTQKRPIVKRPHRQNRKWTHGFLGAGMVLVLGACTATGQYGVSEDGHPSSASGAQHSAVAGTPTLQLAERLVATGNHRGAIPVFRQAIAQSSGLVPSSGLGGNRVRALHGLGKALMQSGDYNLAEDSFARALKADPTHAGVLASLGRVHLILGDPAKAHSFFLKAVGTSGNSPAAAYSGLAVTHEILGHHDQAMSVFADGLSLHPNDLDLMSNKALVMAISGNTTDAIGILSSIVIQSSAGMGHRQNLALAYTIHGDGARALRMASIDMDPRAARQTVASFQTLGGLDRDGRMRALLYGLSDARGDLEQAGNEIRTDSDNSDAAKRIAQIPAPEPIPEPIPEPVEFPGLPPLMEPEGWAVQIAAYRTPQEIIRGWAILSERYFDIIGHLEPRRSEVDVGGRGSAGPQGFFYRLNAGPLSGFRESREICDRLIAAGGECWIRPPEPSEGKLPLSSNTDPAIRDEPESDL